MAKYITRRWENYINHQKYSECQLVTALNAYYYLTGKQYCKPFSDEYEELVDLCAARHGSAIFINKIHKKLNLEITEKHKFIEGFFYDDDMNRKNTKLPLPINAVIHHRLTGFHSVLIVDHIVKCEAVRVANFRYETRNGWIFIDDLKLYASPCFSGDDGINSKGKKWNFRLYKLKNGISDE